MCAVMQAWVDDHIRRAIACGYDAFCLTVDTDSIAGENAILRNGTNVAACGSQMRPIRPVLLGATSPEFNKKTFDIPLILKGIAIAEDAEIAVDHGVECVYVSNHGGRQLDHGLGSCRGAARDCRSGRRARQIVADGAITRGSDVVKAIALGADAVAVGPPLRVCHLAAASTPGVKF